jgi:cytoskeleton protein RodZ
VRLDNTDIRGGVRMDEYVKETLGEYLKREREARHISLEDIPIATRISSPFIRALEENDFGFFSQKEAIPGYLKLYARHLGLDYDDVLRRYTIQSELNERSRAFQQLPLFLDFASPIKQVSEKKWSWRRHATALIIAAVVAVTLTGASLYLYLVPGRTPDVEIREPVVPPPLAHKEPLPAEPALPPAPPAAPQETVAAATPSPPLNSPEPALAKAVGRPVEANAASPALPAEKSNRKKKVIGNRDSKRYHLPGMKYFDKVKAYHRVEFNSEEEAVKAGYSKARE